MTDQVFIKASYEVTEMPGFWRKLKRYIGHFRIEQQSIEESFHRVITISFHTDKIKLVEGKTRQVDLEAKMNKRGSWYFTKINYWG